MLAWDALGAAQQAEMLAPRPRGCSLSKGEQEFSRFWGEECWVAGRKAVIWACENWNR